MKTQFYPTDITYDVIDGKAVIKLYGRTTEGKQICVLDPNFEPYFTVVGDVTAKELESLKQDDFRVTRVEKVKKNLNEHPTEAFKVYVNIPKAVPALRELVKKLKATAYEADILFARRYLIDKEIIPLTLTAVEGKETAGRIQSILAEKIKPVSEEHIVPKILALDIETYNPDNKIDMKKNPIIMIGLSGKNFHRVLTWKKFPTKEKYIEFLASEADCLQRLVELVKEHEPDFITGYFTDGFDFPYLAERARIHKVKLTLGLDNSELQILGRNEKEAAITGIPHIDIFKFIRKVMGRSLKTDVYTLDAVAKELIGKGKHPVDMDKLANYWDKGAKELDEYAIYNLVDCKLTYELTEKVLPNLIEFVKIIRLPPYDINRMTFSTFVEWYLMQCASKRNEILLNKPSHTEQAERMRDRIQGAFVYEPTPGFYKNIAVFDFRSLYPSIIASHNISKGTLSLKKIDNANVIKTDRGTFYFTKEKKGLFAEVIADLVTRRGELKKQIKTNKDPLLAARSEALKLLANSFYGYMNFAPARYYCIECGESTTAWARHYITQTIDEAKKEGFTVLYSDTDSVFLLLDKKTNKDALEFMENVNKKLPGMMELDYEGHYPAGLFVGVKSGEGGAKKKYALVNEKGELKIRGFETVRRNTAKVAKEAQLDVLNVILKEHDFEKAKKHIRTVIDNLRANKTPLNKVVIRTMLTKGTESYASVGPHVVAAQRMQAKGTPVSGGSIIEYVVVKGKGRIKDKVKLPDECTQEDYDGEYYIENQVIPAVERIFSAVGINVDEFSKKGKQSSLIGF